MGFHFAERVFVVGITKSHELRFDPRRGHAA